MPTALYARYVPPKSRGAEPLADTAPSTVDPSPNKRKLVEEGGPSSKKIKHGHRRGNESAASPKRWSGSEQGHVLPPSDGSWGRKTQESKKQRPSGVQVGLVAAPGVKPKGIEPDKGREVIEGSADTKATKLDEVGGAKKPKSEQRIRRRNDEEGTGNGLKEPRTHDRSGKHAGVLSKYEKALSSHPPTAKPEVAPEPPDALVDDHQVHDLVPLPRPKRANLGPGFSAMSALPSWLSHHITVSKTASSSFEQLGVGVDQLEQLRKQGFETALPVQTAVLPLLLPLKTQHPGDICVSAVTGSGKTLAYVLPIVQDLQRTAGSGLRALIVVPTRELVNQVQTTLDLCSRGSGLRTAIATGAQRLDEEQEALVAPRVRLDVFRALAKQMGPGEPQNGLNDHEEGEREEDGQDDDLLDPLKVRYNVPPGHILEYESQADILVTTPGRLVDHINLTEGFSLQKLQWLVIDEADRLLDASFQEWVQTVNDAMRPRKQQTSPAGIQEAGKRRGPRKVLLSATMTRDLAKLAALKLRNPKLVVVEDTEQLDEDMGMREQSGGRLAVPHALQEYGVPVGDGSDKPLHLLCLLDDILVDRRPDSLGTPRRDNANRPQASNESGWDADSDDSDSSSSLSESSMSSLATINSGASRQVGNSSVIKPSSRSTVLIFASSTESAARLSHLLSRLRPAYASLVATLTKSGSSDSTVKVLSSFRKGTLRILIATDRVSRGLDLEGLGHVVNYDVPNSVTSYVHRVGRTARAGKEGTAWTLIEDRQARWFWKDVAKGTEVDRSGRDVTKLRLNVNILGGDVKDTYADALRELGDAVRGKKGD